MANSKISALTSATTPLAGTETLPIVQSSTTKQVSVANLTAGRAVAMLTANIGDASSQNSVFDAVVGSASATTGDNTGLVIVSNSTGKGWLGFNNANNASIPGQVTYNHSTNVMDFYSSGTYTFSNGNVTLSTGNLVIGTSGKGVTTGSAINLGFGTNGSTSQATLDTNGKLIVGGTSTTYGTRLGLTSSATGNPLLSVENTRNVSGDTCMYYSMGANTSDTSSYFVQMFNTSQDKVYIYGNGSFANRTGTYGTISDVSMKENIVDATSKLADVNKLQVRNFNFIGDDATDKQIGFIAQEFESVFPNMVFEDGKTNKKQIKTSVLIPILVKAVQELSAEVAALKAQITPAS